MKEPELSPFIDRRYWGDVALGDDIDPSAVRSRASCIQKHKMARKVITELYNTSRYPLSIVEYTSGDELNAEDHQTGSVLHMVQEIIVADPSLPPNISSEQLPVKPRLHPGGEYIPQFGQVGLPVFINDGSLLMWNKTPGNTYLRETIADGEGEPTTIKYMRFHTVAVVERDKFLIYDADEFTRAEDGVLHVPIRTVHEHNTVIPIGETEILKSQEGKLTGLHRVNGAELLIEGNGSRTKSKSPLFAAFLRTASNPR